MGVQASRYVGDYAPGSIVRGNWTSISTAFVPTNLGGSPALAVYKDDSTTESTSGITLTTTLDARPGLNNWKIDTSSDGTFYSAGSFFEVILTGGTVGSTNQNGMTVGSFSLNKVSALRPTTAGNTLDVSATGEAGLDWANIGSPTTSVALTGTTIATTQQVDVNTIKTNPVVNAGTVTFPSSATLASTTNITAGTITTTTSVTNRVTANTDQLAGQTVTAAAGVTFPTSVASPTNITAASGIAVSSIGSNVITATSIADAAIDRATFAADTGLQTSRSNTAQAGSSSTNIILDSGSSSVDNLYLDQNVHLTGGTGAGQSAIIRLYNGTSKVATIAPAWAVNPDATTTFAISGTGATDVQVWKGQPVNNTDASSNIVCSVATNGIVTGSFATGTTIPRVTLADTLTTYTGNTVQTGDSYAIVNSGTFGNAKLVRSTTPANTLDVSANGNAGIDWSNIDNPTATEALSNTTISASSAPTAAQVATAVWTDLLASSDFSTASSIGKLLKDDVDAAVSSRMATYVQPTGFLAATFPTTVASTTNITGGTITTVTNLTNSPTSGDLTSTMKTSVTTAATAATPTAAAVTGDLGGKVLGGGAGTITGTGVRAVDSSGNAIAPASTALSTATWTSGRAVNLDNLDATITSRMATYSQPTGFLAATFPSGTIANTTNVTAGTMTTVTNLTNAASNGDFTSTMKTSLNAATPASTGAIGTGGITTASFGAGATIPRVTLADTTTNLTNLTPVPTDWLTAAGVKADAVTKIQTGLATPTNITAGTLTTVTNLTNAATNGDFTAAMKTSLNAATPTVTVSGTVVLDATQPNYAPAKAGDAMTLTGAYDAAKTAAQPSDIPSAAKIADTTLRRTMPHVEASSDGDTLDGESLYGMVQQAQNSNTTDTPGDLTVFKTDGTTILKTYTLTTNIAADPITGIQE